MSPEKKQLATLSIPELIQRARAGQVDALEELLRRYQHALKAWASKRLKPGSPGGARPSDVAQDAAMAAFRHFASFKGGSHGEWSSWLRSVVANRVKMIFRAAMVLERNSSGNVPLDATAAEKVAAVQRTPSQSSSHREEWRQLLVHFYALPDDQREAMALRHLKSLPVAEVARRMDRSVASVDALMRRGTRTLRNRMVGMADDALTPELARTWNAADTALLEYFRRRESGVKVEPEAFVLEHPDCAEDLRGLLHWLERLSSIQPPDPA